MKAKELTTKSDQELEKALTERRKAFRDFKYGISGSKVRNVKEGRSIRKDIARILTVLNNREEISK